MVDALQLYRNGTAGESEIEDNPTHKLCPIAAQWRNPLIKRNLRCGLKARNSGEDAYTAVRRYSEDQKAIV